jgi:hypothetical protein
MRAAVRRRGVGIVGRVAGDLSPGEIASGGHVASLLTG